MIRKPKASLVEIVNPQKKTCNRHFGPVSRINIGNLLRYDLLLVYGTYVAGAAGDVAILGAGGAGIKHKVFACGYTVDAAVQTGFRFNSANPRFCVRRTAGVYAQSFPNPVVSANNVTLTLRVEGACNGDYWVQYISEA